MTDELNSLDPYIQGVVREAQRPVMLDPAVRRRLVEALRAEPAPRRHPLSWLLHPRHLELPPLATAALAAGLVGLGVLSGLAIPRDGRTPADQPRAEVAGSPQLPASLVPRAVKFVLIAPKAAHVSVVGDFNGWDPSATPMSSHTKDGTWTVFVPLQPGLHTYSFVLDGTDFLADPSAPLAPDDGYGHKSSVVFVGGSSL